MDRHVKWLRRRIVASVGTQTAETFVVVAVVAFALLQWRTDEGPFGSLLAAVVIAQLVSVARLLHAMRNNPLNYVFMRNYVDRPFSFSVSRFQDEEEAHPVAAELPRFLPTATIRDVDADPEPVFDVYHDPSRLVAASVSRASGAITLVSSLEDGRLLVTDARVMPPHERLVMTIAPRDDIASVIDAHRQAISSRTDVVELGSSAHKVVLDSLHIEYEAYLGLGPWLSPFLDLDYSHRSATRLSARIRPEEFEELPVRLGQDFAATAAIPNSEPERVASVVAPSMPTATSEPATVAAPPAEQPSARVTAAMPQSHVEVASPPTPPVRAPIVAPAAVPAAQVVSVEVARPVIKLADPVVGALAPPPEVRPTEPPLLETVEDSVSAVSAAHVTADQLPYVPVISRTPPEDQVLATPPALVSPAPVPEPVAAMPVAEVHEQPLSLDAVIAEPVVAVSHDTPPAPSEATAEQFATIAGFQHATTPVDTRVLEPVGAVQAMDAVLASPMPPALHLPPTPGTPPIDDGTGVSSLKVLFGDEPEQARPRLSAALRAHEAPATATQQRSWRKHR